MYALIDCNNFYASCERLFRPDLRDKAIVILSNNDGCIIARSEEAKKLGIKMAEPFFKIKDLCHKHEIHVFSSNYTLYGDISHRVMSVIEDHCPALEIYSIDEAFIDLTDIPQNEHTSFCVMLREYIWQYTGIPTSIGIGATKTLAKIANHICKKELKTAVFNISQNQDWLKHINVGEVWGIGRQLQNRLFTMNIHSAADLAAYDKGILRNAYNVVLMRTAMELAGIACVGLKVPEPKKSILSSKSFGTMQTELEPIEQAISSHCARAWEKLRKNQRLTQHISVFIQSNRHRRDLPQYRNRIDFSLINPSDDLRLITTIAKRCLRKIFKQGYQYKKVGICLYTLVSKEAQQPDLFNQLDKHAIDKTEQLMKVFEAIHKKYGQQSIRLAAEGYSKPWAMRSELKSPAYTTRWHDLRVVHAN